MRADINRCSGCGACAAVCSTGTLLMAPSPINGFVIPVLNKDLCVDCGYCETICPEIYRPVVARFIPKNAIACQHQKKSVQKQSASGGLFRAMAEEIIAANGIVIGAVYENPYTVCHKAVETLEELVSLSGSKYLQSEIRDTYKETGQYLKAGKKVLFSGTPCQIAGLYGYLKRDDCNLLTVSVVCHGITSPLLFRSYLQFLEKKYNKTIDRIIFRDKEYGWSCGAAVSCVDSQGNKIRLEGIDNSYLRGFVANPNIMKRPCCYTCSWKGFPSIGDFLIGDYWDLPASEKIPFNRNAGISLALINSTKGEDFFQSIEQKILWQRRPFEEVNGGTLLHSVQAASKREDFWQDSQNIPFDRLAKKYLLPKLTLRRILSKVYRFFVGYPDDAK